MLKEKVLNSINSQIEKELFSSQLYLAMASWAEANGLPGTSNFLYHHAEEERIHMLKFVHYINDRGSHAATPACEKPENNYESVKAMFVQIMEHEEMITESINNLVAVCMEEKDFTTQNFLQWYVTEQIEEESLFRSILDKLNLLAGDKSGMYIFDVDVEKLITPLSVI
jgi:ferritin